ncbi:MAG: siroheme synthase CysG [Pseudomonadota bacterium]
MRYFPIFLDLKDRRVVIVGGGAAAAAKLRLLAKSEAILILIAPRLAAGTAQAAREAGAHHIARAFQARDLDGAALVYLSSKAAGLEAAVTAAARARAVPVNILDKPQGCDFITPALVERAPLTIAISSDAKAPTLARHVKARLDALLPQGLGRLGRLAEAFRPAASRVFPDMVARRRFWDKVFAAPLAGDLMGDDQGAARARIIRLMNQAAGAAPAHGRVALVGAGPGDPDLLTLKAHRALQQADVIVHDRLVSDAVLEFARREAARICVGKQRGHHPVPQAAINRLLVKHARAGAFVVRLKGGDPFIFGRGGEEVEALAAAGVPVEVVPGITAAAGCAAQGLIPLTHREVASTLTLVAGQRSGLHDQDWSGLVGAGRTLVIYMGLHNAAAIATKLMAAGAPPGLPVAIVENGTRPDGRRIATTVAALAHAIAAHRVTSPSLLIVGEVAARHGVQQDALMADLRHAVGA